MLKDFKKFILRGNVVDLAVAVVIGAAFSGVVNSLVKDLITPLIAAVYKQQQFSSAHFVLRGSEFAYGDFVNTLVTFLIEAIVVFFLIVRPINQLITLAKRDDKTPEPTTKKCPECFSEISAKATRCAFCTTKLAVAKNN